MDIIPGPRRPRFPHWEVPLICDAGPFPRAEDFNTKRDPDWWSSSAMAESEVSSNTVHLLDLTAQPIDYASDLLYDLHLQEETKKTLEQARPGYRPLNYKTPLEAARMAIPNVDPHAHFNTVTYEGRYETRGPAVVEKYLREAEGPCGPREYDGKGFKGFPERQGWNVMYLENDGERPDYKSFFQQRGVQEAAILVQAWLFFGLMGEVFGKRMRVEDFTTLNDGGKKIITLQKFIRNQQWASWADDLRKLPFDRRSGRVQDINQPLYMAKEFSKLEGEGVLSFIPFASELASSIRVLGIIIEEVCQQCSDIFRNNCSDSSIHEWGLSQFVRDRMLSGSLSITEEDVLPPRWCINDVARLGEYLPATAMYYMSTMPTIRNGQNEASLDHSRCSESTCVINSIDPETYVSEHSPLCPGCDLMLAPVDTITDIIRRGGIPLIRFANDHPRDGVFTNITSVESINCFEQLFLMRTVQLQKQLLDRLSIDHSHLHVENIMPDPDLSIQTSHNAHFEVVEYDGKTPFIAISHVWSDGMGNVNDNGLPNCRVPFLRRAIWQTGKPLKLFNYNHEDDITGSGVLATKRIPPFWMDTLCIPHNDMRKAAIKSMRDIYSAASNVLVLDGSLSGFALGGHGLGMHCRFRPYAENLAWIMSSPWMRRLWTLQEGILAKNLLFMFAEGPLGVGNLIDGVMDESRKSAPSNIIERQIAHAVSRLFNFNRAANQQERLLTVWNAAITRTASRPGDECLILAHALGLDVSKILAAETENRTKALYSLIRRFPQSVLFNGAQKLPADGYRWADTALMKTPLKAGLFSRPLPSVVPGLYVEYPGYTLKMSILDLNSKDTFKFFDPERRCWFQAVLQSVGCSTDHQDRDTVEGSSKEDEPRSTIGIILESDDWTTLLRRRQTQKGCFSHIRPAIHMGCET